MLFSFKINYNMLMKNFKPHISIILIVISVITFGILTNNGQIGILVGASYALLFDPLILLAGVIIGFSNSYKKLLINSVIVSVIVIAIIQYQLSGWQASLSIEELMSVNIIRFIDILLIAHIVNIPVSIFNK